MNEARPYKEMRLFLAQAHLSRSVVTHMGEHPEDIVRIVEEFNLPADEQPSKPLTIEQTDADPDRVIANYLAKWAWRNGVIDDYHVGLWLNVDAPLLPAQRRFTEKQERHMLRYVSHAYELNYLHASAL